MMRPMMRLDKYLADMGEGTRQEVKKQIRRGSVTVNGETVRSPERKVGEEDQVCLDGRQVSYAKMEYFMLNKPAGVVSATEDRRDRTVLDLIADRKRKDLFPVGRLDKDTEGLLLITNDGELSHRLLSPRRHVDKTYYVEVKGCATEVTKRAFLEGVNIGTVEEPLVTMPADLEILEAGQDLSRVRLTIREGKFHQVKRMFQAQDMEVLYLKRESMGPLRLDESLAPGEYRPLAEEEIKRLKEE